MLKSSFQHLERIGERRERDLWRHGVLTWDAFERTQIRQLHLFGGDYDNDLKQSRISLERGDVRYFAERLHRREHYRIALAFPTETLFLDIETTGLSLFYDTITIVGWSKGSEYHVYVKGEDDSALRRVLAEAKAIVTFNGSIFDLRFIRKEFDPVDIPVAHIDLRFFARRAGLFGPQKQIEQLIGLERPPDAKDLDGRAAVALWHQYTRGDVDALRKLIKYNHADIEGMKRILDESVSRLLDALSVPDEIRPKTRFADERSCIRWAHDTGRQTSSSIHLTPYKGESGPHLKYEDLAPETLLKGLRVVGIDLSGSEKRASGWCELHGRDAVTQVLHSDRQLIATTLGSKPHVVSIDAPLGLPSGRTRVTDDDPARAVCGIMRKCERELRRRGVNVYPSLIPSMQRLTERGIRIASALRKVGVPVIESYPGAAQDIMGIPRKRVSVDLLSLGLAEFGLDGSWTETPVTHDELDAITSALVGVFWWCGRFEALGEETESELIIPDLSVDPKMWLNRRVVGFSGPIEAGKTTAAECLETEGYRYGRFSLVLAQMLEERGIAVTRESLQRIGNEVHEQPGQRWLCERLVTQLAGFEKIVIDGMRHPEDHSYLVERFGRAFTHVFVSAPTPCREVRYVSGSDGSYDFRTASTNPVERNAERLKRFAHGSVVNSASLAEFRSEVLDTVGRSATLRT